MKYNFKIFSLVGLLTALLLPTAGGAEDVSPSCRMGVGYDYARQPGPDYVYRTDSIIAPKKEKQTWISDLQKLFKRKKDPGPPPLLPAEQATELKLKVGELARQLLDHAAEPVEESRVIVSTFVNLHQLYKTSGLGRVVAEQMISELQKAGVEVVDVRMTPAVQIRRGYGEYSLSRDMTQLAYVHDAQAIVAGTYTVSDGQVVVHGRLLQQGDGLVLSSGSIAFPVNDYLLGLLQDESMPPREGTYVELRGFSDIEQ